MVDKNRDVSLKIIVSTPSESFLFAHKHNDISWILEEGKKIELETIIPSWSILVDGLTPRLIGLLRFIKDRDGFNHNDVFNDLTRNYEFFDGVEAARALNLLASWNLIKIQDEKIYLTTSKFTIEVNL